jgi:hypothetical protein
MHLAGNVAVLPVGAPNARRIGVDDAVCESLSWHVRSTGHPIEKKVSALERAAKPSLRPSTVDDGDASLSGL